MTLAELNLYRRGVKRFFADNDCKSIRDMLTQAEVAIAAKVPAAYIGRVEDKKLTGISVDALARIAEVYRSLKRAVEATQPAGHTS